MKKLNVTRLLQWLIFIPIIFPLCIAFGVVNGVWDMTERMIARMISDIEI